MTGITTHRCWLYRRWCFTHQRFGWHFSNELVELLNGMFMGWTQDEAKANLQTLNTEQFARFNRRFELPA